MISSKAVTNQKDVPTLVFQTLNWFATISYRMSIEFPLNLSADRQTLGLTSRSAYHVAASNGTS